MPAWRDRQLPFVLELMHKVVAKLMRQNKTANEAASICFSRPTNVLNTVSNFDLCTK
jgi:hypothetical protein